MLLTYHKFLHFLKFVFIMQAVPMASCFSNSTIGVSLVGLYSNPLTIALVTFLTVPEIYLMAFEETIDIQEFPYSTMALVAGRLPTVWMNLGMPYMVSLATGYKHKDIFDNSFVCQKIYKMCRM